MALTQSRYILRLVFLALLLVTLPNGRVLADSPAPDAASLPSLTTFARTISNGQPDLLRGLYVTDLFADVVVQQPAGDAGYISSEQGVVTQFSLASRLGSTGILAHNYLAGNLFPQLHGGQLIHLVYGDGHTRTYIIREMLRFRALQPNSPYSAFVDVATGSQSSAGDLFSTVYDRPGSLVLQTCIEADGLSTWGRLFVIAEPYRRSLPLGQTTGRRLG